ncbi:GIY-YIG nuclease family protein [Mesorhizobium sp. P5_C1]
MALLAEYSNAVDQMPSLYEKLLRCDLRPASPRTGFPKKPGVYALYENTTPIYVGRAKNIWQRIGNHIGGRPEQSSFAFKVAREKTGRTATYKPEGSRKALMLDEIFKTAFTDSVTRIRALNGRYVVIEDDILQHLFEVYAALALKTSYNEFRTS